MGTTRDIAILGSGPAALSIGAAAARLGCDVTVIAPDPDAPWAPTYCLWEAELPANLAGAVEHRWPSAVVATDRRERVLDRAYVKLDGPSLASTLWHDLRTASARIVTGAAISLAHDDERSTVSTDAGTEERARIVIDATGAESPFVRRVSRGRAAYQIAYGLVLEAPSHRFDPGQAVLMDFRPAIPDENEPPSFLYALPLGGDRLFVEETSLAHRPAVSVDLLRKRLGVRLGSQRVGSHEVVGEEYCRIPMGVPLPLPEQDVVPFGAAASMVNPASGYSIARSLRKAEPVARAIAHALANGGRGEAIAAGNAAVWPSADRAAWGLYTLGLESLVDMTSAQSSAFFNGFFETRAEDWSGYLGGTLSPREVGGVMARVFRCVPPSVQWYLCRRSLWHLVRRSFSSGFGPLAKVFLQPGAA